MGFVTLISACKEDREITDEMTALKKAGESRTKLHTSKLCMVTQERGEEKQSRDFSLGWKITR